MQIKTSASIRVLMVALAALAAGCAHTGTTASGDASMHKVEVEKQVVAAKQVKVPVEAEYADIPVKQLAEKGCYSWSEILCDTNMTTDAVTKLQNALAGAGYYTGEPSGKFDDTTMAAVKEYERANNLPVDGYLNIETARTLGVVQ